MSKSNILLHNCTFVKQIGSGTFGNILLYQGPEGYIVVKETDNKKSDSFCYGFPKDFINEIDLLTKFQNHPNVVNLLNIDFNLTNRPIGYISMEKLDMDCSYWFKKTDFEQRLPHLPEFIRGIGNILGIMHKLGFVHNDIKSNNILLKHISPNNIVFKLSDFGKSIWTSNPFIQYSGISTYTSPSYSNIFHNEAWAFCVCITEFLLGKHMFHSDTVVRTIEHYTQMGKGFCIKSFLKKRLHADQFEQIPSIYWKFVKPIFAGEGGTVEDCMENIGHSIQNTNMFTSGFNYSGYVCHPRCDQSIDEFCQRISKRFIHDPPIMNFYVHKYIRLMNYFFSLPSKQVGQCWGEYLSPVDINKYCAVGYITIIGATKVKKLYYFDTLESFCKYQEAFLKVVNYQTIVLPTI